MQLWTKIRDMLSPLKESLTPISHPKRPVHCRFEIRVRAVRDKNQFCIGKENIIMITYSVILAYTSLATSITSPSA